MKQRLYSIVLIIILILGITNEIMASEGIKSFDDVAADYGLTADELNRAIEQGLEPEDLEGFKFKEDNSEIPTASSSVAQTTILIVVILFVTVLIYLIPTIIAVKKSHPNKVAIILIDIFLGWSLIGWLGALVWACINPSEEKTSGNKYENLNNLQRLKEQGVITEEEFENEKNKLLK